MRKHSLCSEEAEIYSKYIAYASQILLHDYMVKKHNMAMLKLPIYQARKAIIAALHKQYPQLVPDVMNVFEIFNNYSWEVAKEALDVIADYEDELDDERWYTHA